MSFIGSMVAAAGAISAAAGGGILGGLAVGATGALGGAGLGAAASAIDGGDPLEGAQLGAGIGSAVFGGLGVLEEVKLYVLHKLKQPFVKICIGSLIYYLAKLGWIGAIKV